MYSFVFIFFTFGPLCLVITHIFLTSNIKLLFCLPVTISFANEGCEFKSGSMCVIK